MSGHEYGPPQRFEVTWLSGHVETIEAHQVTHKSRVSAFARLGEGEFAQQTDGERIDFHGEIKGDWTLVLSARVDDLRTVRRVTDGEHLGGAL